MPSERPPPPTDTESGRRFLATLAPKVEHNPSCHMKNNNQIYSKLECDDGVGWERRLSSGAYNMALSFIQANPVLGSIVGAVNWLGGLFGFSHGKSKKQQRIARIKGAQRVFLQRAIRVRYLHGVQYLVNAGFGPLLEFLSTEGWLRHSSSPRAIRTRRLLEVDYGSKLWDEYRGIPLFRALYGRTADKTHYKDGDINRPAFFKDVEVPYRWWGHGWDEGALSWFKHPGQLVDRETGEVFGCCNPHYGLPGGKLITPQDLGGYTGTSGPISRVAFEVVMGFMDRAYHEGHARLLFGRIYGGQIELLKQNEAIRKICGYGEDSQDAANAAFVEVVSTLSSIGDFDKNGPMDPGAGFAWINNEYADEIAALRASGVLPLTAGSNYRQRPEGYGRNVVQWMQGPGRYMTHEAILARALRVRPYFHNTETVNTVLENMKKAQKEKPDNTKIVLASAVAVAGATYFFYKR